MLEKYINTDLSEWDYEIDEFLWEMVEFLKENKGCLAVDFIKHFEIPEKSVFAFLSVGEQNNCFMFEKYQDTFKIFIKAPKKWEKLLLKKIKQDAKIAEAKMSPDEIQELIDITNSNREMNIKRLKHFYENRNLIAAVQFETIMDSCVSDVCEERNGKIMFLNDPLIKLNTPPLHLGCRSTWSPINCFDIKKIMKQKNYKDLINWKNLTPPLKNFEEQIQMLRSGVDYYDIIQKGK